MTQIRDERDVPTVYAHRTPTGSIEFHCPYCGTNHIHGSVAPDAPVGSADGHRVAHCVTADSPYLETGYDLVELAGPPLPTPHVFRPKYLRDGRIVSGFLRKRGRR